MTNTYSTLKQKHQEEVNNFPMGFAFSNKQFEEAMEKLGLTATDTDKVVSIGGGGFIRKTDSEALGEMWSRHKKEMKDAIDNDTTGDGFIYHMFSYELANHEYGYTGEIEPALDALGLTIDEINASESLLYGLNLVIKE
ncbi:hypothetical protein MZM54_05300 [[Brevibacterium] frigoritolerans]|nr:hypothetical protein [Peribacillus frigoritolerans]